MLHRIYKGIKTRLLVKDVVVEGWQATGSTAIYQICEKIGLRVEKVHGHWSSFWRAKRLLFTIRDPRDIVVSIAKRNFSSLWEEGFQVEALENALANFLKRNPVGLLYEAQKSKKTVIIRYESFFPDNQEALVYLIADDFGIPVTSQKLSQVLGYSSLESNKQRAKKHDSFDAVDKETKIHGNHISNDGRHRGWRDSFSLEFGKKFDSQIGHLLVILGYEKNNDWLNELVNG